ncbi:hypothetical protein [Xanthocytophaga flava]|uniref:hypothetical protein n=1 Tax=Xanthocytophaga flava TaxID=3048013 RepID=UPI0028D48EA0|nr:hypothetical protein [Xanthocytophaga flavus]MDJ1471784.1 hypothetical protein [Xanthocytophaga flavus]
MFSHYKTDDIVKQRMKLIPEFECYPIWIADAEGIHHNISIDSLLITSALKKRLEEWDSQFQATFNSDYPPDSDFTSESERDAYQKEGVEIYQQLVNELGNTFEIRYYPSY